MFHQNRSTRGQSCANVLIAVNGTIEPLESEADGQPSSAGRQRTCMKERNNNQSKEGVYLPPAWCGSICRNAMSEICVESCAIKRDCSAFEPKRNLKLADMPSFPLKESADMTKEERFSAVAIYLSKIVDHLQGREDEPRIYPPVRSDIYASQRNLLSDSLAIKDLLAGIQIVDPAKGDE